MTLDDLKDNLRVLNSNEDKIIERLAATACLYVEECSGRKLNKDQYSYSLDALDGRVSLPVSPILSIESIVINGVAIDLATVDIDLREDQTTIYMDQWPTGAAVITFNTGYPENVVFPENLKQAAILRASHWYLNREATGMKTEDVPFGVDTLIDLSKVNFYV